MTSTEFQRFDGMIRKMLSVPREDLLRREAEYRKQVDANLNRRGPKLGSRMLRIARSKRSASIWRRSTESNVRSRRFVVLRPDWRH